jgi:hypothetical protein
LSPEQDPAITEPDPIDVDEEVPPADDGEAGAAEHPESGPGDHEQEHGGGVGDAGSGTSLEARPEMLPELAAPHRAGAIVSEFVASIVEEAQARAAEVAGLAGERVSADRRDALDAADRMRTAIDAAAADLSNLLDDLRSESKRLGALRGPQDREAAGAARGPGLGEEEALAQVAAGLERGGDRPTAEDAHAAEAEPDHHDVPDDVEVVGDPAPARSTALEPRQMSADELAEDQARFARMSDEELARAYSNAVGAYSREDPESDRASRLYGLAAAALGEAMSRPSFEDGEGLAPGGRLRGRRKRQRAAVINELRAACQEARATMAAEEAAAE